MSSLTPEEQAALERLRNPIKTPSLSLGGSLNEVFDAVADLIVASQIALRDHPADDPDGMKRVRAVFDAGFNACRGYGDNHHHYRGEQADSIFAVAMKRLGIELKG